MPSRAVVSTDSFSLHARNSSRCQSTVGLAGIMLWGVRIVCLFSSQLYGSGLEALAFHCYGHVSRGLLGAYGNDELSVEELHSWADE